ncbi:MAG TPA: hypothetical protein VI819_01190 [Patescibacteria group bacterium]|nr:hypothetical protein [Patescibacteria group bacterium]
MPIFNFKHLRGLSYINSLITASMFFLITPVVIALSLYALLNISSEKKPSVLGDNSQNIRIFSSLPPSAQTINGYPVESDARGEIVKSYLQRYDSILEPYSFYIVNTADKYDVDFRLVTAIAQQESNLCKAYPEGTFNCWGWGIHSRGTLGFSSFEEGINTVTKGIRDDYLDEGYTTPEEIMTKYTPLSNGSWAEGVSSFMSEME